MPGKMNECIAHPITNGMLFVAVYLPFVDNHCQHFHKAVNLVP
jgi:hypothetical protein